MAEILIALAINSIVILAVMSIVSGAMVTGKTTENRQELATDFGLLQNYFAREIPNAGGMSLPAESAFWVEDNCSTTRATSTTPLPVCDGSDRLTIVSSDVGPVCTISTWNTVTKQATFSFDPMDLTTCCLNSTPIAKSQVMFVNGYDFAQLWVSGVDPTTCTATFSPGPMATHNNTGALYNWKNGLIVPIKIDTFYREAELFKRFTYKNGGLSSDGDAQTLADRMLDFQVALGYDFNPAEGVIFDDGSSGDEWLYNAAGDVAGAGVFATLPRNSLRMISVGWIIGTAGAGQTAAKSASVLNGPVRSKAGYVVQAGSAKFGVRSVYVFD